LINAEQMPKGRQWVLTVPDHAFGTAETVANLVHCIRRVAELFEDTPPVMIGSISARSGGPLPPHKSHRTGRDVDIYFYRKPGTKKWFEKATAGDLDAPRTWALLRTIITDTDVEFVLIDRFVKELLETYALAIGEEPAWISVLFHGEGKYKNPLVKHVPGHTAHMHVRFVSAAARERGRRAYDRLVEQGHVTPPSKEVSHSVVRGDTLIGLSKKYRISVSEIQRLNGLETTLIRVGQRLKLREREDLVGAREPVVVPQRRLPPPRSTTAATSDVTNEISAVGATTGIVTPGES
jgi:LysM repeat protein